MNKDSHSKARRSRPGSDKRRPTKWSRRWGVSMPENKEDIGEGERLIRVKAKSRNTPSQGLFCFSERKLYSFSLSFMTKVRSVSNSERMRGWQLNKMSSQVKKTWRNSSTCIASNTGSILVPSHDLGGPVWSSHWNPCSPGSHPPGLIFIHHPPNTQTSSVSQICQIPSFLRASPVLLSLLEILPRPPTQPGPHYSYPNSNITLHRGIDPRPI